ncbi:MULTISPECIES: hypothetical protein [Pasteurellaceae]|uniref:hypothetical protein n=1 Tax=Pasteurellaceae TaxID=712 RepID=UPI0020201ED0|nr:MULTISPECIES: hypothetical protein [Pasteurellaceae]MCL7726134.1 hypothetical protein [Actinobacillus pleuropneumoniae]MCL7737360.1 hypothetical protein [Actinobacillus pleuropneumoniae]MDX3962172.1 hypothetical protein [Pasteurella multocida]
MTTTENQDLRQEMANCIELFEEAIKYVREGDFKGAGVLWDNGRKLAFELKAKIATQESKQRFDEIQKVIN